MKTFLKVFLISVVVIFSLKSCTPFLGTHNVLVDQSAPDFTLNTLSGQKINMTEYRAGRPAVIFFWATWCPHCRTQLKELSIEQNAIKSQGIKIILVDVGEPGAKVESYAKTNNISMDIFLDEQGQVAEEYQIIGVPTFFLLDKQGGVVAVDHALPDNYVDLLLGLGS